MELSKADKMFKELGYIKSIDSSWEWFTSEKFGNGIGFFDRYQEIQFKYDMLLKPIEIKAINEKMKELGWLDE